MDYGDEDASPTNGSASPLQLERLLLKVEDQSVLLKKLLEEVAAIRSTIPPTHDPTSMIPPALHPSPPNILQYRELWQNQILKFNVNDDVDGLLKAFVWKKGLTLEQLLSPHRSWNSWQYRLSYPRLSAFLQEAAQDHSSRSQVICEDLNERGKVSRWESKKGVLDQESLWKSISTRAEPRRSTSSFASTATSATFVNDHCLSALSRNMRVLDLSPMVAAMILGATPRINLSNTAPFLERHLSFCNWGRSTLFGMKPVPGYHINAFVFEYHFAFYFVPRGAMDPELAVKDFRNIRRSSAFGPTLGERSQWIYEEQLSILLMGQGADVFTTYQLAERYFRGPYIQGTGHAALFINPDKTGWTPCSMFLSWILMALHHVRFRWQSAIEAVDNQIVSPSTIIFSEEDPDLLSDDPQFSRSKTYFWALQAYKMFDERLEQTINTWMDFRNDSLNKLNDGRMSEETWDFTVASIDLGIDKLRQKLHHVREKSHEVRNLREGLFGASALFDSRTTVRQGDNIRLLTYITLLFLPLSFGTSIFGMQVVLPQLPLKVFIITMPTIFVFTAVLVFNLQNFIDAWEYVASKMTFSLRESMRRRKSGKWNITAKSLYYDMTANQGRKRPNTRKSSHWSYFLYGVELLMVYLPVHETNWLATLLRKMGQGSSPIPDAATKELSNLEISDPADASRAARVRAVRVAQIKHTTPQGAIVSHMGQNLFMIVRLILMPISLFIVGFEYMILVPFSLKQPQEPLHWLGVTWLQPAQEAPEPEDNADEKPMHSDGPRKARKMTIVSIAGSDNVFQSHKLHPSRHRRRMPEDRQESVVEGIEDPMPEFRDVFGGGPTGRRDFAL